jgi:hypothetical protein
LHLVASAGVPELFEFGDYNKKDGTSVDTTKLQALKEGVNKILKDVAVKDMNLEFEVKRFLDIMQELFISFSRSRDIYEISKLEIAYETLAVFLQLKLDSLGMNDVFFINIYNMFKEYEKHSGEGVPQVRHDAPGNFVKDMIQMAQSQFTEKEFESISKESPGFYYDLHQYLVFQYLMTLDKDQFAKLIFKGKFPQSTEKLLHLSNDEFILTLKGVLENLHKKFVKYYPGYKINESHNTAFPKLYQIALPEIKKFKWLDVAPVQSPDETKTTSSKPNPGGNGNDQGLFDGKGKIFAICAVVVIVALLGGGFAFWHLRLRKKNPIAPHA